MVGCPQCGTPIQPTWDWCEGCGFDPEGMKPAGWRPAVAPHERPATAPRPAAPPPDWHAPPPGARPAGRDTAGGYQPGGFAPPPFAPPPGAYPPGMYGSPPPQGSGGAGTVIKVLLGVGVAFVLLIVVCIAAVTLLGKNASSKFSRIDTAIGAPASPTTSATWATFSSPDKAFTVEFPLAPQTQPVPDSGAAVFKEATYASYESGDGSFAVAWFDLADDLKGFDEKAGLDGALKGMVKSANGTLLSSKSSTFAGVTSVEGTISMPKLGGDGRAVAMMVGRRMIVLFAVTRPGSAADVDRFLASFHLN